MIKLKQRIKQHLKENRAPYLLVGVLFITGFIAGYYQVWGLEGDVKEYLLRLIESYLKEGADYSLYGSSIFLQAFWNQARLVLLIWMLGLTVIGIPLILAVVFLRGYALGFTLGFLYHQKAGAGVVLSLVAIFPQNLVYVPFLLVASVIALNFSQYLVKGRNTSSLPLGAGLLLYSLAMLGALCFFLGGAFIEAYLSPWLLQLVL